MIEKGQLIYLVALEAQESGRLAQGESASFTRKRSQAQIL